MSENIKIPAKLKTAARKECQAIMDEINGLTAVVVCTVDGFDLASSMRSGDAARVAAMASSIAAISDVVSQEAELGRSKSVTIATESGFALVCNVYHHDLALVIIAIADGDAVLGKVNYRILKSAASLTDT